MKIDWNSKRIGILNVILSTVLWFVVFLAMVWEIMLKGTLDLTGGDNIGVIFGVWFGVQLFYAYKCALQRALKHLKADGFLKNEP